MITGLHFAAWNDNNIPAAQKNYQNKPAGKKREALHHTENCATRSIIKTFFLIVFIFKLKAVVYTLEQAYILLLQAIILLLQAPTADRESTGGLLPRVWDQKTEIFVGKFHKLA